MSAQEPWAQLDNEPGVAYAAFLIYRNLGPQRSIVEAYRQYTGDAEHTQPSGRWNHYSRDYAWQERARAYDRHLDAARVRGAAKAAERSGASMTSKWANRRDEVAERLYSLGASLLDKAATLSKFPVHQESTSSDGKTVVIEPADPKQHSIAATIAWKAQNILLTALAEGAAIAAATEKVGSSPAVTNAAQEEANRKLEAWRETQRGKILAIPTDPPESTSES